MDDEYTGAQNHGVGAEPQALWERDNVNLPRGLKPHGHWDDRSPTACKSWGKTSYPGQVCDFQHFIYLYFIYFLISGGGHCCPSRDFLKVGVSLMTSAIFFPFLVWGGFVFLPFDAPLLDGAPLRMIYALRCSVFASTPIVLGDYNTPPPHPSTRPSVHPT